MTIRNNVPNNNGLNNGLNNNAQSRIKKAAQQLRAVHAQLQPSSKKNNNTRNQRVTDGETGEAATAPEGFVNMNIFGLRINRTCLILIIIFTILFMYKEKIMKTKFVKNFVK